ncbi:MFS transporter [Companilactobacillus baiquanensis]|uniref:MFS transporter n=1 Tax=Companilactobacillus baiquanensis TaxID=2486005 RepID=A0ABW1UWG3_9LACO|nr:MFS transporter [Companilactobacillus baiquanensis]
MNSLSETNTPKTSQNYFLFSMMLIAANLRLPITIMPPLLRSIEKDLNIPSSMAGLLTSIPLIAFAIFSPIIVKIAKNKGNELTILLFFILLLVGSYLRVIPTVWALFLGTALVGIGIDSGNVLVPAIIKDHMPNKIPLGTALYTLSMLLIGAIGTAFSGYFITRISLSATLAILSVMGIIAFIFWIPNVKNNQKDTNNKDEEIPDYQSVWHQSLGWLITLYFGFQSLIYYSLLTWLPRVLTDHGVTTIFSSNLLTVLQIAGLPLSFIVPMLAPKKVGMGLLTFCVVLGYFVAPLAFLLNTTSGIYLIIWAIIAGVAQGIAFNTAIFFFTNKTTNPYQTAEVSGMAQSAGYLLAAFGPVIFGVFKESSYIMIVIAVFAALLATTGIIIYRARLIKE